MEKLCPTCSERFADVSPPRPGRPREYCSKACRRHAEQRRLREREAKRRADIVTTLDPGTRCLHDMAIDNEEFDGNDERVKLCRVLIAMLIQH